MRLRSIATSQRQDSAARSARPAAAERSGWNWAPRDAARRPTTLAKRAALDGVRASTTSSGASCTAKEWAK